MPFPFTDVRIAKAVTVLPREHRSLDVVIRNCLAKTIHGLAKTGRRVVNVTYQAARQTAVAGKRVAGAAHQAARQMAEAGKRAVETAGSALYMVFDPDPVIIVRVGEIGYYIELCRWDEPED